MEVLTKKETFLESAVEDLDISRQLMSQLKRANINYLKDLSQEFIELKKDKKFMRELKGLLKSNDVDIQNL